MLSELKKNKKNDKTKRNKKHYSLGAVFDKHIRCEFQDHDVDATMKTMVTGNESSLILEAHYCLS